MNLSDHADSSFAKTGFRCEDIHEWIDAYFNHELHRLRQKMGFMDDYNPFDHRKHRHFIEAADTCVEEFRDRYSEDLIREVFIIHLEDDYDGYIPSKNDFEKFEFNSKYHKLYV